MFRQRLMTAGVLIALFVAILSFSPPWLLCIVATVIILLATWEYLDMTCAEQSAGDRLLCLSLASLIPAAASSGRPECLYGALFTSVFLLGVRAIASRRDLRTRFEEIQLSLFGILYVSLGLSHFLLVRNLEAWKPWIFTILIVTYAGDFAAYASGTRWGRTKLSPLLSPKKTVEGAVGGLLASVLAGYLCKFVFFSALTGVQTLWVAVALSISGQLGDLLESLVKRSCGAKDSGRMLPGHGGILDRIDSILFAGPVGYYLAVLM